MAKIKVDGHEIELSNQDKVLFPKADVTKGDLIEYYQKIKDRMFEFVKDRPISMVRHPDGVGKKGFFQKDASDYFPDWIKTKKIKKGSNGYVNYVVIDNKATLIYLANQACISPHPWLSKADKLDYPDKIIFDLDPIDVGFSKVRKAAKLLKGRVEKVGLTPFAMLTGSKGIHVVIPIKRKYSFDKVRKFAKNLVEPLVEEHSKLLTLEVRKEKRKGLIFIDYLRNAFGQTSVAPYGVRARENACIATPIFWREVDDSDLQPDKYTIKNIFQRLAKIDDPWKNMQDYSSVIKEI